MSDDPVHVEAVAERRLETGNAQARAVGKGPLILAKLIVSYLEKRKEGYWTYYSEMVEKLNSQTMPVKEMGKWLRALKLCVSYLSEDCKSLVAATLRLPWYIQSQSLVELYLDYLANLLSAQVCHVEDALSALTLALLGPDTLTVATKNEAVEQTYSNIHSALKTLLDTVPRAVPQLVPALSRQYPFRTRGTDIQEVAVKNCLHVTTYCPTITEDILNLLINKMVTIDAEIRLEDDISLELMCNDEEESEPQFHVDMEQEQIKTITTAGDNSSHPDGHHGDTAATTPTDNGCRGEEATPPQPCDCLGPSYSVQRVMRNSLSESLDIHMTVMQNYIRSICYENGNLIIEEAFVLLQTLFKVFSAVIMPTHAISHVQFLVFYTTSFHKEFPGFFLDFLWKKFEDVNVSVVLRQTAAAYMASYIARSKFISVDTAKLCLLHMMQWLHQYLDVCDPSNLGPYIARHGPFFSLCQAVFYIFVFRHQSLVEMENGLSFLRNLNFERIVTSKLNPLRVCLPNVVEKFSKLASHHEVVFCYTILEANKRLMLILAASLGTQSVAHTNNHLDCFFPFDPYWLHRSGEVIQPIYQEWDEEEEGGKIDGVKGLAEDGGDMEDVASSVPSSCLSLDVSYEATTDCQHITDPPPTEFCTFSPN